MRAYERRDDLRANNSRLLEYVHDGGTLIVQYNRTPFNQSQYGPYPAKVSDNRVTDETSPVVVLAPNDPLMTFPNRITSAAWKGWVQERGLNFLGEKDSRYRDILQLAGSVPEQRRAEARFAGRGDVRQGPLGVRRPESVAAAARGHRRRVPDPREPDQPRQGAERTAALKGPRYGCRAAAVGRAFQARRWP